MEVWAWGTNIEALNDCVKQPVMLPMISGQAVDPVRAVAAFGDKMMVRGLSHSPGLQGGLGVGVVVGQRQTAGSRLIGLRALCPGRRL